MTTLSAQLGVKDESTYGTPVTVDKFFEFTSEGIAPDHQRIESKGLRATTRVLRQDRFMPNKKGAAGPVSMDVPTKGFGWWLKHMLGAVSSGTITDSNYTHTATVASLLGDFFTLQLNRPFHPSGTAQAFTYHGGKIPSWELGCEVDGNLTFTANCDFEDEDTSTGLATASYPTDFRIFTFVGGSLLAGGSSLDITNLKVAGDNKLKTDRHFLRNSTLKKEPVEQDFRDITWEVGCDFDSLTQRNRFTAAAAASTYAAIVATFDGPIAHGGATVPRLEITIPAARFDAASMNIGGPEPLTQSLSGMALDNGTDSPITITYRSTDATP